MPDKAPSNVITIDLDTVNQMALEGGKLMYTPEAEEAIVALLTLQELIDKKVDYIKGQIAEAGKDLDPNFKGVVGERVKSIYRTYGEKYRWDGYAETPKEVLKTVTTIKVDGPAIDTWIKEKGEFPKGIEEKERTPVLSLKLIEYEPEPTLIK